MGLEHNIESRALLTPHASNHSEIIFKVHASVETSSSPTIGNFLIQNSKYGILPYVMAFVYAGVVIRRRPLQS